MINSDQTTSKHVQVGHFTMAPQSAKKVKVARIVDKRMLLRWLLLWMEKLYHFKQHIKEKPRANIPADFSLITNIKQHSNTQKVLKHLEETVISYVVTEKKRKTCSICTFNMGRFSRSKTDEVTLLLRENKVVSKYVPNDMSADFQVLDLQLIIGWRTSWRISSISGLQKLWEKSKIQESI